MFDDSLLDNIYHAVIYALIFWFVGQFIPSLVSSYSSSRITLLMTINSKLSKCKKIIQKITSDKNPIRKKEVKPFHVVLIDINKAVYENKIHCIEKPLDGDHDLKFIALSYRWGEVDESLVDTNLDYLASITSFHLDHFYRLCKYIKQEPDLKSMEYVWVDAICVDQANYERRKATIYRMTSIYERANFILAVPDLNLQHLIDVSKNNTTIELKTKSHSTYIYHLIQGNMHKLAQLEENWLDSNNVPNDQALRQMLAKTINNFADGLMEYNIHDTNYRPEDAFQHIQHAAFDYREGNGFKWNRPIRKVDGWEKPISSINEETTATPVFNYPYHVLRQKNDRQHQQQASNTYINNKQSVPFDWLHLTLAEVKNDEWKELITKRNGQLEKSLLLLVDLIKDWSTRAWVVSEYSIASKKESRKMKYWFVQLDHPELLGLPFFEFDFVTMNSGTPNIPVSQHHPLTRKVVPFAQDVKNTMAEQLQQKTFVEKMLLSKATKNEDRFSAIFPGMDGYKDLVKNKDTVRGWQITNLLSVKLKLYEMMTTEDKLELLFLSSPKRGTLPLTPTFATCGLDQNIYKRKFVDAGIVKNPMNFNIKRQDSSVCKDAITLIKPTTTTTAFWRLHIKPTMYYMLAKDAVYLITFRIDDFCNMSRTFWSRLGIHVDQDVLVPICIPLTENGMIGEGAYNHPISGGAFVLLIGSFEKNKWILYKYLDCYTTCINLNAGLFSTHYNNFGFDIY